MCIRDRRKYIPSDNCLLRRRIGKLRFLYHAGAVINPVSYTHLDVYKRQVYEPDAALFHAEGSTRGLVEDPEDAPLFNERWRPRSSCDPYYNPNLNRNRLLFRVEP